MNKDTVERIKDLVEEQFKAHNMSHDGCARAAAINVAMAIVEGFAVEMLQARYELDTVNAQDLLKRIDGLAIEHGATDDALAILEGKTVR